MAGRIEFVLDFGCGTATSAALYYLLFYPKCHVIGYDKYCTEEWVRSHLPESVQSRFHFVGGDRADIGKLTIERLDEDVRRFFKVPLKLLTRAHWSHQCKSLSDASRGHHRDDFGNPKTDLARADDLILAHGIELLQALTRVSPTCQCTIENPVSRHFAHLRPVQLLLRDPQWRLLAGSHCSNLCEADTGDWPQKDTYWLTNRVPRKFHLDLCDGPGDCNQLLHGTDRHKLVLCNNSTNLKEQYVISLEWQKSLIPLGVFRKIDLAHRQWLAKRDFKLSQSRRHTANAVMKDHYDDSDSGEEASSDSDSDSEHDDDDEPIMEDEYDSDGNHHVPRIEPLRDLIHQRQVPMADCTVHAHALCYPALQKDRPRWQVEYLQPWQLIFADLITFDFRVRGSKAKVLLIYDLVTDGVRCVSMTRKAEIGAHWDKLVVQESLHLRPYKVTVVTDGCGAMHGLLVAEALRRDIDHLPIPPHQPHLNNIEGIVASFKADVAACLLKAMADDGPLTEAHVAMACEHVAYVRERFPARRTISALNTGVSRFEMNVGVA
ncbi:MAG: hypothetical protein VX223_15555, partial [Myxococcota bacterium]|nr:hypothetical protein [Myxococcota bacterium]